MVTKTIRIKAFFGQKRGWVCLDTHPASEVLEKGAKQRKTTARRHHGARNRRGNEQNRYSYVYNPSGLYNIILAAKIGGHGGDDNRDRGKYCFSCVDRTTAESDAITGVCIASVE